jgi:prevent-host-death family protein
MLQLIGSRELRSRFAEYLECAEEGDEFVILVHGRPAAVLRPVRPDDNGTLVRSRQVRNDLHTAISRVRVGAMVMTRYSRVVAVLEAPPAGLNVKALKEAS